MPCVWVGLKNLEHVLHYGTSLTDEYSKFVPAEHLWERSVRLNNAQFSKTLFERAVRCVQR